MARITKKEAINALKKYITEIDGITHRAQADVWYYKTIDSLNIYVGDTALNRAFKEFSMSRIAKPLGNTDTSYNPDGISDEVFRHGQKLELKAHLQSIVQYIEDNGVYELKQTYDNPFTGMSFKAKVRFWGGVIGYTFLVGGFLYSFGKNQPDSELEETKIENIHLKNKFDSVFKANTFQNYRMEFREEERMKMEATAQRVADSITLKLKKQNYR